MTLDIWLGDALVATAEPVARGRRVRIAYRPEVVERYPTETPLLSCSLPMPGPAQPAVSRSFLEGLLPEGAALSAAAAEVRGVRLLDGAPENPADVVNLLAEYGRDCAGAVIVLPSGTEPDRSVRYRTLNDEDLAELLGDLPQHPLGANPSRDIRMSLAGAQEKLLLARIGDRWCLPLGGAPSTHIIKPTTAWPDSARNEALTLALGRAVGLDSAPARAEAMGDSTVLVAERYDRHRTADGTIIRLHQEDLCQAVGLRPSQKYEIGRPSTRMASVLREFADQPRVQVKKLFRQVAFRVLVGDEDGHGKNYSVLLDEGRVSLAPLYDSLCTLTYPQLTGRMGAGIGRQHTLAKVDRVALIDEARAMGLTGVEADDTLNQLADALGSALESLDQTYTSGWSGERVVEIVQTRLDRLLAGEQLGDAAVAHDGAATTFDLATRRRQSKPPA